MAATINIISVNGSVNTVVYGEESVRKFELMKEDYIRLVFSSDKRIGIRLGDSVHFDEWGTFYITEPQKPTYNTSTGGYDYDIQFNAPHYRWNNKLYKFEPNNNRNEASWSLTSNLKSHMAVFLRNLSHHGWNYTVDPLAYELESASRNIFIQFENKYILDALSLIAEKFNVEWWITDNIIHFGKTESGTAIDFEIGKNVEDMTAENGDKDFITRIYAFGSTANLPANYRENDEQILLNGVVQKRLMLPEDTPFVDVESGLSDDEVVDGIVFFDDVFPRTESKITEVVEVVKTMQKTDTTIEAATDGIAKSSDDENDTEEVTLYRFKTDAFKFSEDYLLAGEQLQVHFISGKLNGMAFDLAFNPEGVSEKKAVKDETGAKKEIDNPDAQLFEIVRNDKYGLILPNETLFPSVNDTFVLTGWNVTKMESGLQLITKAQDELLARTQEYAGKLQIDPLTYPCKMMSDYMYGLDSRGNQDANYSKVGTFPLGQRIRLVNSVYFKGGSRVSRVVGYEYKLDIPYDGATIIVGESATYSSKRDTEAKINDAKDSINYRGGEFNSSGGGGVYVITSNDSTAPTEANVYSAIRSDRQYPRKNKNDVISSLWTFKHGNGLRRGIQTEDYNDDGANEDNLFGKGFELVSKVNKNGDIRTRLEIDELFVRIKAFFAKLEIRDISYVGGNYAFSSAGSKIYYVEWIDASGNIIDKDKGSVLDVYTFRCYLYSDDGTTATINKWETDDQAMCRTFNIDEGVYENVTNKYYWRRVQGIGKGIIQSEVKDAEDEEAPIPTEYQYVDISMDDCDINSDFPEAEDTIVQFGNWTDAKRQGLIYLMVEGESAPAIMEYSGVGANGKHFVLPDPTLLLSPKKNIIYGEFHSVVDEEGGNTGNGDTIDDQLRALIDALNDVKNQADKRFELWFGAYVPLPTKDNPNQANYPASEWTTEALKALHAQDLFYDTLKAPATNRGRAWRWVAASSADGASVTYYWEDVTDQDTIDALEKIADVASDGKLTGGAEKTRVLIDWQKAVQEYFKYTEQARDYKITTELTAYVDAFKALGKMLNDGNDLITSDTATTISTPAWLADLQSETIIQSPTEYRDKWNGYYTALAALLKAITQKAKELADEAQKTADEAKDLISDIASDGKLDPSEKLTIKREFIAAYHEKNDTDEAGYPSGIIDRAMDGNGGYIISYDVWVRPYIDAFLALGNFLNGGAAWSEPALADFTDSTLPSWIKAANMSNTEDISGDNFRKVWSDFYSARTAVITALSEDAKNRADNAQGDADDALEKIAEFGDDNILTPFEKITTLREWDIAKTEKTDLVGKAEKAHVSSISYVNAFNALSWFLDDPTIQQSKISPFTKSQPAMLVTEGSSEINGLAYKNYWTKFYSARMELLSALSTSKANFFVSNDVPMPPYYVGDFWMQTNNDNNIMVCVTERTSGSGQMSDWSDLSDITEKRDPRILLAALVNMVYSYNGGYLQEKGANQYQTIYLENQPINGSEGDLCYYNSNVYQYVDVWEEIANETLRMTFKAVYDVIGTYQIRLFRTRPTIAPKLYDIVCSTITFYESISRQNIEGGIQIQMYNGSDWEVLQESTRALMQNLGSQLRSIVLGSDNNTISASGIITQKNISRLFAQASDTNGKIITEAYLEAYTEDFVDENGVKTIVSGLTFKADKIDFTSGSFTIGAEHIDFKGKTVINGKFAVDTDGNVTMDGFTATNATITGKVTAADGKIGPFTIGSEGLYSGDYTKWATSTKTNFCYLNTSSLLLEQQVGYFSAGDIAYMKIGLGRGSDPDNQDTSEAYCASALYVYRKMNGLLSNSYRPAAKIISDNVANRNIALRLVGGLQVHGGVIEKGHLLEINETSTTNVLDLSFGTNFLLGTNKNTKPQFFLPTLSQVRKQLGIESATEPFNIRISVSVRRWSSNLRIATQLRAATPASEAEGGKLIDNNGNEWGGSDKEMGPGDAIVFNLVYASSIGYYVQLVSLFA